MARLANQGTKRADTITSFILDIASMLAVNHDHESVSEKVGVGNLPHVEILYYHVESLDIHQERVSGMVETK